MEDNHREIQTGMETMRMEFHQFHSELMERFDRVLQSWNAQERERKEKGVTTIKPLTFSPNSEETQASTERGHSSGGAVEIGCRWDSRVRRLDMPVFDGQDPDRWIFRVERYFMVNRMTNEDERSRHHLFGRKSIGLVSMGRSTATHCELAAIKTLIAAAFSFVA